MFRKFSPWSIFVVVISVGGTSMLATLFHHDIISPIILKWGVFAAFVLIMASFPEFIIACFAAVFFGLNNGYSKDENDTFDSEDGE